jgi:hypothetical protein
MNIKLEAGKFGDRNTTHFIQGAYEWAWGVYNPYPDNEDGCRDAYDAGYNWAKTYGIPLTRWQKDNPDFGPLEYEEMMYASFIDYLEGNNIMPVDKVY